MNKLILTTSIFFITIFSFGQRNSVNAALESPWTIGAGVNFIHNNGLHLANGTDFENWNFKNPFIVSVEKRLINYLAAGATISINTLEENNLQNNIYLDKNLPFFAIDLAGKFYYDQFILPNYQLNFFEGYILTGLGYTSYGSDGTVTFNAGLGFQFWLLNDRSIGLRLQSVGKWGSESIVLKNYIEHSIEIVWRFY